MTLSPLRAPLGAITVRRPAAQLARRLDEQPGSVPVVAAVEAAGGQLASVVGATASVVAITGVAVAGSQSLPGDPFYGVKRQVEAFSLRTADGDVERGTRHLDHAATRLREVGGLVLGRDALTVATSTLVATGVGPAAGVLLRRRRVVTA